MTFRSSKTNRDRRDASYERSVRSLREDPSDDKPIGECEHCGAKYFDTRERTWHQAKECIGGEER